MWGIRDKAFFIGNGNSWSISPANSVRCKNNGIYFVDDIEDGLGHDAGVYNVETWQTEFFRFGAAIIPSGNSLATWITPGLTPNTFR